MFGSELPKSVSTKGIEFANEQKVMENFGNLMKKINLLHQNLWIQILIYFASFLYVLLFSLFKGEGQYVILIY